MMTSVIADCPDLVPLQYLGQVYASAGEMCNILLTQRCQTVGLIGRLAEALQRYFITETFS